jgi:hypothetical protein
VLRSVLIGCVLICGAASSLRAQDLTVVRPDGSERRLTAAELASLPQQQITATDHGVLTRFEGVELRALLRLAGAGPTDSLRGPAVRRVVFFVGADGYAAAIALAELDPALGARPVFIVSRANGAPLPAEHGPWRVIIPSDGRAARWVRQLQRIEISERR